MITTRTSDRLAAMAYQIQAIASAVYEAGFKDECRELEAVAIGVSIAARSIEQKIEAGARAMLTDHPAEAPRK